MYETMLYWETAHLEPSEPEVSRDYTRVWQAAEKIVYSRTLESPLTARTRVERDFRPESVQRLKSTTLHDLTVSGADLAGQAIAAGLVDEIQQFVAPVLVGGGKPWLPKGVQLDLELLGCTRFASGFVLLRYGLKPSETDPSK